MRPKIYRNLALFLALNLLCQAFLPFGAYALTGGPSQPEVQSFEPVGTSEMVDLSSGDFNYNIPLIDVGGYPVNLSYHSGITTDQEASWVGLGWNINPGVINRNARGIPDDFSGDLVTNEMNIKDNHTYGGNVHGKVEVFGINATAAVSLSASLGINYNNYKGYNAEWSVSPSISAGDPNATQLTAGLGLSANTETGVSVRPEVSFSSNIKNSQGRESEMSTSFGANFNSREGLKTLTFMNADLSNRLSFGNQTYVPQVGMNMSNLNVGLSLDLGGSVFGIDPTFGFLGYYSGQFLQDKLKQVPAFGYLYAQNGNATGQLLDFNREKDGVFSKNTPNLPLTNFCYDLYNVAGQGIAGTYRPFRSEIGAVYDNEEINQGGGANAGLEFGVGNLAKSGFNITDNMSNSRSGKWNDDNGVAGMLSFKSSGPTGTNLLYEPSYFKEAGERSVETNSEFFQNLGGKDAVRVELSVSNNLTQQGANIPMKKIVSDKGVEYDFNETTIQRTKRQNRNESISFLTAQQAAVAGLETGIRSYKWPINPDGTYAFDNISRTLDATQQNAQPHHISEVTALKGDGSRYVFGIPAYNSNKQEVSFAVNATGSKVTGLVNYNTGENSIKNGSGLDNHFNRTTTPPYAYSYLLTAVLSADYVDLTGDGPSDDDLGNYTKINYTRVAKDYKWRVPSDGNYANYNPGLLTANNDDRGNYLYGDKEIWYVHSIESRTQVAEFTISDREDGFGVTDENGGTNFTTGMKKLDQITLYAKPETSSLQSRIPIKTVHFVYDYSLCPGVANRTVGSSTTVPNTTPSGISNGKLTLKKVYFTYGTTEQAALNPYSFSYADLDHNGVAETNYSYNLKAYDRWGNYKANTNSEASDAITNAEFPYVPQDKATADSYAGAWALTSFTLPSGGVMNVSYEADDYAYVQDRNAMQMFTVAGVGSDPTKDPSTLINQSSLYNGGSNNNVICFQLKTPISSSEAADLPTANALFKSRYLKDQTMLYFKCLVDINNVGLAAGGEYISGYADIEDAGVLAISGGFYNYGYVKLKAIGIEDENDPTKVNPISKACWNFTKLRLPQVAYKLSGSDNTNDSGLEAMIKSLIAIGTQVELFLKGVNATLLGDNYGKNISLSKSWIRLYEPSGFKEGGGCRVKEVSLTDSWKKMSGSDLDDASYGQTYTYQDVSPSGDVISSGVASYEPQLGGDENPFRQPVFFTEDALLAPDSKYYLEEPFGESFFPSPQVGYSKVTVKNKAVAGVKKNATGFTIHEFYTAKDFPVITRQTTLDTRPETGALVLSILKISNTNKMTASQGYSIELNDMHGKPKSMNVYAEDALAPLSGREYFYKQETVTETFTANGKSKAVTRKALQHNVNVIDKNFNETGKIRNTMSGVDFDMVVDMREHTSNTYSAGPDGNFDLFLAAIFPITIPVVLPSISKEDLTFRSSVATKVVQTYGILDKVVVIDNAATIETRNLLYDAGTGQVVLTSTTNEFNDTIYTFNYPAYWGYEGMGLASKNEGLEIPSSTLSNITNAQQYFFIGDELLLKGPGNSYNTAWVTTVNTSSIAAIDVLGNPTLDSTYNIKVIRSGRRNMQNASMGSVSTMDNPLRDSNGDGFPDQLIFTSVLNASSTEYDDNWQTFCDCVIPKPEPK